MKQKPRRALQVQRAVWGLGCLRSYKGCSGGSELDCRQSFHQHWVHEEKEVLLITLCLPSSGRGEMLGAKLSLPGGWTLS